MSCEHRERLYVHALRALSSEEARAIEAHASACSECREELASLRVVVDSFVSWPTDVLRPSTSLRERLSQRIAAAEGSGPWSSEPSTWSEPAWEEAAPGVSYQVLAIDDARDTVSMLVRLAPGADYPPHRHGGVEELHLLDGELRIDDKTLHPGDYSRAEAGTSDARVWSETGCTCVLITSTRDALR